MYNINHSKILHSVFLNTLCGIRKLEMEEVIMRINKPLGISLSVLMLLGLVSTPTVASDNIKVTYNSSVIQFTEDAGFPYVDSSRVLVPLRAVSEGMNKQVNWDTSTKQITVSDDKTIVKLAIGNKNVLVNGVNKTTDVPAMVNNGRTYVPLRFVSECIGADVNWDATTKMVAITDTNTNTNINTNTNGVSSQPSTSRLIQETIATSELSQLNYLLYIPDNATADMPLIVYLHGGSGKGNDLNLLTNVDGFPKYVKDNKLGNIPAYIIMPQLPANKKGWTDIGLSIKDLIEDVSDKYKIDENKISLTGHSMGGTGVWGLATEYPKVFSCIAPMSGSIRINEANIEALSHMPVWAFVGSADTIVSPTSSIEFIQKLSVENKEATITVFEGKTHFDVPESAYLNQDIDIVTWLLSHTK